MRCYICDYCDNHSESLYHAGLAGMRHADNNRVNLVNDDWVCDQCTGTADTSVRASRRVSEPNDPKNYYWNVDALLDEFKEDCPGLYAALGVDVSHMEGISLDSDGSIG